MYCFEPLLVYVQKSKVMFRCRQVCMYFFLKLMLLFALISDTKSMKSDSSHRDLKPTKVTNCFL